ncbi:hypothetical protein [Nitrosarchaeum sp. AC2]|uniref:hypothetical protein n=1 Tax=Nitrosarchaeum sp. AC2 TaxID=2259673 RepID=UPI0015CD2169|nr:hypothetical protein [Nitrosarchaeum sp. AC2]QLH11471.1 hypothetical protein DSQ20_08465 [Nitrosarchaeum sp. AC2]
MGDYCERCRKSLPRLSITTVCDQCKERVSRERIEMEEAEKIRANRQTQKSLERQKKLREKEPTKSSKIGLFSKFRKYDDDGYDKDGIHRDTNTKFNTFGFDREGYDRYGNDSDGHSREYNTKEKDNKKINYARWVHSPSDNFTNESSQHKYEKTNNELKEKELDIYKKFQEEQRRQKEIQDAEIRELDRKRKENEEKEREYRESNSYKKDQEEQRRQKEIRDAEIRERENQTYKKFQEDQLKNPRKDSAQNYRDNTVEDLLKNLANEIFKENPQQTGGYSYTPKQESKREYRPPPKPTQQKTMYSNVPDFSSDDPDCVLGVFPDTPISEKNQRRRELLTQYDSSRNRVNRSEKELKELERIQAKIHWAWEKIKSKT